MSKPIKLFIIDETDSGLVCQHVKSAFNIENLFRYIDCRPDRNSADADRCIEAIKSNGAMYAFLGDVKKFHFSREDLLREVDYERSLKNVIQGI